MCFFSKGCTLLFQIHVMKSAKIFLALGLLVSSFLFTHCTTESGDVADTPAEMLARGTWAVDHYFSGSDQTPTYAAYQFIFSPSGIVSCTESTSHCEGDWQVLQKVESEVLRIELATPHAALQELNDQWTISETGAQSITLKNGAEVLKLRRL